MSTDCGSIPSQIVPTSLGHPIINSNNPALLNTGINYQGKVSFISPLNMNDQSAMGVSNESSGSFDPLPGFRQGLPMQMVSPLPWYYQSRFPVNDMPTIGPLYFQENAITSNSDSHLTTRQKQGTDKSPKCFRKRSVESEYDQSPTKKVRLSHPEENHNPTSLQSEDIGNQTMQQEFSSQTRHSRLELSSPPADISIPIRITSEQLYSPTKINEQLSSPARIKEEISSPTRDQSDISSPALHKSEGDSSPQSIPIATRNQSFDMSSSISNSTGPINVEKVPRSGESMELSKPIDCKKDVEGNYVQESEVNKFWEQNKLDRDSKFNADVKKYNCTDCPFETISKNIYDEHCNHHYNNNPSLVKSPHTPENRYSANLQKYIEHCDEAEQRSNTNTNVQSKSKTYKCKTCSFITTVKTEYWEHGRIHMKKEKILSCKQCTFITEYKHHLEYHESGHKGEKPFACKDCNYVCVNKSMLNSHQKSHSNVYQYRCSDCSYATKYCHSLKLHLRKLGHTPAMVLNPDGSPNPVPIIDVYGTRRGPKLKKDENGMPIMPPQYQLQAAILKNNMHLTGTVPAQQSNVNRPVDLGDTPLPYSGPLIQQMNPTNAYPPMAAYEEMLRRENQKNEEAAANESPPRLYPLQSETEMRHNTAVYPGCYPGLPLFPQTDLLNTSHGRNQSFLSRFNSDDEAISYQNIIKDDISRISSTMPVPQLELIQQMLNPQANTIYQQLFAQSQITAAINLQEAMKKLEAEKLRDQIDIRNVEVSRSRPETPEAGETSILGTALDLSKEQSTLDSITQIGTPMHNDSPPSSTVSPPTSDVSTPPTKSRRKGKAFKIDNIALRLSSGDDLDTGEESTTHAEEQSSKNEELDKTIKEVDKDGSTSRDWNNANYCKFCSIAFMSNLLHTIHMGYHGYTKPFQCNRCGVECKNEVDFSIHLNRVEHE